MKRYKLLKDLPTIKAGEIFKETVTGYNEKNLLVRMARQSNIKTCLF